MVRAFCFKMSEEQLEFLRTVVLTIKNDSTLSIKNDLVPMFRNQYPANDFSSKVLMNQFEHFVSGKKVLL
jgi:hypothetical protein